jgi:hypothetical protein
VELLRLTIYKNLDKPSELIIDGKKHLVHSQNDMFDAIRTILQYRLTLHHETILKSMKEKGVIKSL